MQFDDHSVTQPFDSTNADCVKRQIRDKIVRGSVTVVYLCEKTASSKWVNCEIEESIKRGKGVIGVYRGGKAQTSFPPDVPLVRMFAVSGPGDASHLQLHQSLGGKADHAAQEIRVRTPSAAPTGLSNRA